MPKYLISFGLEANLALFIPQLHPPTNRIWRVRARTQGQRSPMLRDRKLTRRTKRLRALCITYTCPCHAINKLRCTDITRNVMNTNNYVSSSSQSVWLGTSPAPPLPPPSNPVRFLAISGFMAAWRLANSLGKRSS